MALKQNELNINDLKKAIEQEIRHPYLAKFLPDPVISEDKLMFLSTVLNDSDLSLDKQRKYIITTMLVQIALDTHELVTLNQDGEDTPTKKDRQLTVLAGDYYSGLYYYLLSKLDDLPMIRTLASAIKEINELKMRIYTQEYGSMAQVMDGLKQVESLLIQRVAQFVNKPGMNQVAGDWLLAMRLQAENNRYREKENAPLLEHLLKSRFVQQSSGHAMRTIEKFVHKHLLLAEESITQLPQHFEALKQYLQQHIYNTVYFKQHAVEEG